MYRAKTSSTAANQLSVTSVFGRNSSGVNQTLFTLGAGIQDSFTADNTGSALTSEVHIEVFWYDANNGGTQILDNIWQNISFPSGQIGYYTATTVPTNAVPGPYTIQVTLCYNDSSGGTTCVQGNSQMGDPTVTGIDRLAGCNGPNMNLVTGFLPPKCGCPGTPRATCVPYWDQYAVAGNTENCGPTSVAMTLNFYRQGPAWTQTWAAGRTAGINAIRNATGKPGNSATNTADLEKAIGGLGGYGGTYQEIIPNPSGSDFPLVSIAGAIRARQPVIAFIDGSVLGRRYGMNPGHWLVVIGFATTSSGASSAILYDPDYNPVGGAYKGGYINVPLATFNTSIINGTSLGADSIVVTS